MNFVFALSPPSIPLTLFKYTLCAMFPVSLIIVSISIVPHASSWPSLLVPTHPPVPHSTCVVSSVVSPSPCPVRCNRKSLMLIDAVSARSVHLPPYLSPFVSYLSLSPS